MAATYTKPTKIPRWADTGTRTEPSSGKKDTGWTFEEAPPYGYENWLQGITGDWLKWIDERFDDGPSTNPEDSLEIKVPGTGSVAFVFMDDDTIDAPLNFYGRTAGQPGIVARRNGFTSWFSTTERDEAGVAGGGVNGIYGEGSSLGVRGKGTSPGSYGTYGTGHTSISGNQNGGIGAGGFGGQGDGTGNDAVGGEFSGGGDRADIRLLGEASTPTYALEGDIHYNTTDDRAYIYDGANWKPTYPDYAYWFGALNSTTQVTNSWTNITPDTASISKNMSVTSSQLKATIAGKYLINVSLQFNNSSYPAAYLVSAKVMKDGSGFEDWCEFLVDTDTDYSHAANLSCIVEFDPVSEYIEVWAMTGAAGETIDAVADESTMTATLIEATL